VRRRDLLWCEVERILASEQMIRCERHGAHHRRHHLLHLPHVIRHRLIVPHHLGLLRGERRGRELKATNQVYTYALLLGC